MKYRQTKSAYVVQYLTYKWFVATLTLGFSAIYDYLRYKRNSITLGNKSVQLELGVFTKNSREIPYRNIQSVTVNQSISGRMFNYGHLIITTANDTDAIKFRYVANPQILREAMQGKMR